MADSEQPDDPITPPPIGLAAWLDPDPRSVDAGADTGSGLATGPETGADTGPETGAATGTDTGEAADETLFRFPCAFPIKAMGRAEHDIAALVLTLAARHAPELTTAALTARPSSTGTWVSVTVTVQAQSKAQLDAIYRELTAHEHIAYVL